MSERKARQRRREEGNVAGRRAQHNVLGRLDAPGVEVAIFEEIEPSDPRFGSFGPNATRETLDEALRRGDLHPDCPLCQAMLAHSGPSILNRVVPDTDAEG